MRKALPTFLLSLFMVIAFGGGYWFGQAPWAPYQFFSPAATTPADARDNFTHFWEVWNLLHANYYEQPLNNTQLVDGAIEGMLATLDDPNTRYLPPAEEQIAREGMAGEFQGIGAEIENVNGDVRIVAPFEGSPAAEAGLQPGDILRQANGVDLTGMDAAAAAALVRGPAGTQVRLTIERDGQLFEVAIIRDTIKLPSVRSEMLDDGVAYIRLSRFGNTTSAEMSEALTNLMAQQPAGLILDLRSNPGGGLTAAVEIADQFLSAGIVITERFGDGREKVFRSTDRGLAQEIPLVILVDEGSASASEVVAGAIRDRARGVLIGETTYGKGTVQTWHVLSNGGGVRITVAQWITPSGVWVDREGLEPDYIVHWEDQGTEGAEDTQLQAAINYLLDRPMMPDGEGASRAP
jgi:carboxyl-terminal processing protease